MAQKIIKTGNSAAVTIPVEFFDSLCLRYGDRAEAELDFENSTITYKFLNGRQLPLAKPQQGTEELSKTESGKELEK